MLLNQYSALPDGILDAQPEHLHRLIPEPSLFHLSGKHPQPLFVSVMQHGNEPTGFLALQALLNKYKDKTLPRSLSLFFGNTLAAEQGLRRLPEQPDFNRIWPGTDMAACPESHIAEQILAAMQQKKPFASIDVHNNTGINPHYACVNKLDYRFLQLASLFSRLTVYFTRPHGVQSLAFADICPAVTLECGRPGQQYGVEHAFQFIDSCLHLSELSDQPLAHQSLDIYHTVAQVTISEQTSFSFVDDQAALLLNTDLESMNFTEIPAGTHLGRVNAREPFPVIAVNESGDDVTDDFFTITDRQLQLAKATMPSMLTLDQRVIEQDCLCYLMEKLNHE